MFSKAIGYWQNSQQTQIDLHTATSCRPRRLSDDKTLILLRMDEEAPPPIVKARDIQSRQSFPARIYPLDIDVEAAGQEAIKLYDTNKDGKISGAELDKAPALKAAMETMGTNKDKGITADDITARIKAWQATKVGRIGGVGCTIIRNGKPVEDAEVKYVPEDFHGENHPNRKGHNRARTGLQS